MSVEVASKCVHKGCGKLFTDLGDPCIYHPGPPVFHEGQKGWGCCKPRVLTFDEFMSIPPCTTGKHSAIDDTPKPVVNKSSDAEIDAKIAAQNAQRVTSQQPAIARAPVAAQAPQSSPIPAPPEDEDDDPDIPIPDGASCKRKSCGQRHVSSRPRSEESCVHHPGSALFHEGSKGWTCCKRRVLEFDEFMKIPGCTTKSRHLFVGRKKNARRKEGAEGGEAREEEEEEEKIGEVRSDFYQTATTVIASLYLKKIVKERSSVEFKRGREVELDLHTTDRKRYTKTMRLFGAIDDGKSTFKIMGTKLELTLAKADGAGWPVLKADDRHTGEIIQAGRAGRV